MTEENAPVREKPAKRARAKQRSAPELTREDVAQRLLELYQRCLQAEQVMAYDKDEKEWIKSGEWKVDARGAVMALEQLSELMGFGPAQGPGEVRVRMSEEAERLGD